jgi:hypothetical protein
MSEGFIHTAFLGSNLLYYVFYRNQDHLFLSTLYQHDKYGVVINYSVVSLITISTFYHTFIFHNMSTSSLEMKQGLNGLACANTFLTLLKCFIVNNIFMLNTSDVQAHKNVHLCGVFALSAVSLMHRFVVSIMSKTGHFWRKTLIGIGSGLMFLVVSKICPGYQWSPFVSTFFEAISMSCTIGF